MAVSLNKGTLQEEIDRSVARKEGKTAAEGQGAVDINSSLYVAPRAAGNEVRAMVRKHLQAESQTKALANAPLWHALYRTGVVFRDAPEAVKEKVAGNYLGFVPVSPDGSAY